MDDSSNRYRIQCFNDSEWGGFVPLCGVGISLRMAVFTQVPGETLEELLCCFVVWSERRPRLNMDHLAKKEFQVLGRSILAAFCCVVPPACPAAAAVEYIPCIFSTSISRLMSAISVSYVHTRGSCMIGSP